MAMTKNIRTTVNTVSKLFALVNESHNWLFSVKCSETAKESIEASKMLNNCSKRVDRLCAKLGLEREVVDEVFEMSEGYEDAFVLHLLSTSDCAFLAYKACNPSETAEDDGFVTNKETFNTYPGAPCIAPAE